jgi:RimJ/RimL family protein N-acetyltransferase
MTVIETKRLTLRELNTNDAPFIRVLLNTPLWLKFIGNSKVKTIEDAEKYITRVAVESYRKNGFGLYLTSLKTDDTPVGLCGFIKRETLEDVDIGFAFLPEHMGHGFAFEASSACLRYAKNKLMLKKIVAITLPENERSTKLLEKIGLHFEKMIKFPNTEEELMLFATSEAEILR